MPDSQPNSVDTVAAWPAAFGKRLQDAREHAGMSKELVHDRLGYTTRTLSRWESGLMDPGCAKVAQMAELYGVSLDWIVGHTSIRQCIRPGMVMIDNEALDVLARLVEEGASVLDVPEHLLRNPGVEYAAPVPVDLELVAPEAAKTIEERMRRLWRQLGGD